MLSVLSLKQIPPHNCHRKIPYFKQNVPVLCGLSVSRRQFDVWQVMDTIRHSTFPDWMNPAEWRDPVIPVLPWIPSEQNTPGLQGQGGVSWLLFCPVSLHVGNPLPTGAGEKKTFS